MVFSSLIFIFIFLPVTIGLHSIIKMRYRNLLLILASLFFYAWGEPIYVLIMITSIFANFIFGLQIGKNIENLRKVWLILSIIFNLGLLGVFKYSGFVVESLNRFLDLSLPVPVIALPIGISFYTFQILSYIIDVYRDKTQAQRNPYVLALYISLFPQLIAGPIVRYVTIESQIISRSVSLLSMGEGVRRFLLGLGKKVILANALGEFVDTAFEVSPLLLSTGTAWLAIIAYALQIYFDFSGYSDMAIGLGKMLGFDFEENFNYPYISRSVTEFWRRWHISLSSWFRDYLYIPLGGNRVGFARGCINLFIVWFLTGLWHGASWNFVLWGLWFGAFIWIERIGLSKYLTKSYVLSSIYLIMIVLLGWVLFRAGSISNAITYYQVMFTPHWTPVTSVETILYLKQYGLFLILGILAATPIWAKSAQLLKERSVLIFEFGRSIFYTGVFVAVVLNLVNSTYNPFIYFRF